MTSRERVKAAFSHEEPDRTPIMEYVLYSPVAEDILKRPFVDYTRDAAEWLEIAAQEGFEKALKQYVRNRVDLCRILGHDMLYLCPNPVPGTDDAYNPVLEGERFKEASEDPVERMKERNALVAAGHAVNPPPLDSLLVFHLFKEEMKREGLDLPILAPAYFHGVWSDVDLMQTMALDEDVAHEHFFLASERAFRLIDAYAEIGIEMIGIGGDFAGNRLLISPEAYRRFIVGEVKRVSDRVHGYGSWAVNATDGNLWDVIDDFLIGCGVDGYLEIDMGAGMDLTKLKLAYGDRITFLGNMDCGNILSYASPEVIAKITREILEAGSGRGGHIFTASNAITETVPLKNYCAMVNAYREAFGLARLQIL